MAKKRQDGTARLWDTKPGEKSDATWEMHPNACFAGGKLLQVGQRVMKMGVAKRISLDLTPPSLLFFLA
jgi:hypothetical protein